MRTISFAGTAKNTGKTTTALYVVDACHARGLRLALTSIGYDGELKDNVTGLPKPRYVLQTGDQVATAEKCLKMGTAGYRVVQRTDIHTVLGEILMIEITTPGLVVLAGPNRSRDLEQVKAHFAQLGVEILLVDGALNRLVPMICTDGLVLSTGAAFNEDIPSIAAHASALCKMFNFTAVKKQPMGGGITVHFSGSSQPVLLPTASLLSDAARGALRQTIDRPVESVLIPNACDPRQLKVLLQEKPELMIARWIFGNPLKLIASGSPLDWQAVWARLSVPPQYIETLPLCCLTVNPFYPVFEPAAWTYSSGSVNPLALLQAVRRQVHSTPVIDLRQPPVPDMLQILGAAPGIPAAD